MDYTDYFQNLLNLLDIEEKEDKSQHSKTKVLKSLNERVEKGIAWYQIKVTFINIGLENKHLIGVERITNKEIPHVFKVGNTVSIFNSSPDREGYRPIQGLVTAVEEDIMHIAVEIDEFPDELPDWLDYGSLGVEKEFNMPTYKKMRKAVKSMMKGRSKRDSKLRDVILQKNKPTFKKIEINIKELNDSDLNNSQKIAIQRVLQSQDIAIIHGPPGTGKTTTLVEAIFYVLKTEKQVLVTAPSNAAVDLLTLKLSERGLKVLRLGNPEKIIAKKNTLSHYISENSDYYFLEQLRKQYQKYKNLIREYKINFYRPDKNAKKGELRKKIDKLKADTAVIKRDFNKLEKYITKEIINNSQVIATTLVGADHPSIGNNFSTVFIDEAGQALEPAVWIPVSKARRVVMVGDHFQLPPVVKSEVSSGGLSETLFEKTIKTHSIDIMLKTQYRMHEHIMNFSNEEFYGNKLSAAESVRNHSIKLSKQGNTIYSAVEFIDTVGLNANEQSYGSSQSWYNEREANILVNHLLKLLSHVENPHNISFSIGVISPYKGQVLHMRKMMKENKSLKRYKIKIDVNSVDSFQGQERDVIYISLVRSNDSQRIGFLSETRRMNVALTRARKKLVIIGDSSTISGDPFYERFLSYIKKIGAYHNAADKVGLV